MRLSTSLALAASISAAAAGSLQGFNYGAAKSDGSFQYQSDFEALFKTAKAVSSGFSSARLYTMIQGGSSTNEPISAIPAAIAQDTTLLLGLWASGGDAGMQAEITALKSAIEQYGTEFTDLVVGISVGSEDLYRVSPTGIAAKAGYGTNPDDLVRYIKQVKAAIAGTSLSKATIGHVDTWTAWANSSNSAVAEACDWVGMDAYPYFQNSEPNSVEDGADLFNDALEATQSAVGDKEVWITETGWPVSGKTENLGVANTKNAKTYWDTVGCPNFGKLNVYWYTLQDADPVTPNPSFGVVGSTLSDTPLYDLSCNNVSTSTSTSKSSSVKGTSTAGSTATGSGTGSSATSTLSHISSPSASSGSDSGSGSGSGSGSSSGFSSGAAGASGPSYGAPSSPTGGVSAGNGSISASGTGSRPGLSPTSASGTGSVPVPTSNAAVAMLVSGPAAGFLAAAAAVVAML